MYYKQHVLNCTFNADFVGKLKTVLSRYTCVALLRGINVGGKNVLPMKDLVALLEDAGSRNVKTYIRSGNAIFQNDEGDASLLRDSINTEIEARHGFRPRVVLLEPEKIRKAIESNPFPEAEPEAKTLHVYFAASTPKTPTLTPSRTPGANANDLPWRMTFSMCTLPTV